MQTLSATVRDEGTGKSIARKLRATGLIPAVVYSGGSEPTHLTVNPGELTDIFRKTQDRNTIVHLQVDGETIPTIVRDAQRHPVKRDILHVDFYRLEPGQVVEVMVKLNYTGRAKGMALGGRIRLIRREIKVRCAWEDIPSVIEHDVTDLDIGEMVKASQLTLPDGVELILKNDFNVMNLYGKRAPVVKPVADAPAAPAEPAPTV